MGKVARRFDAPLIPERGLMTSSTVDADLRDRIRSLLVSRNRHYPPKTPCTTPDFNHQTWDNNENPDLPPILPKPYRFSPAQAIAELTRLTYKPSDMGATRFDGPAGQVDDDDSDISPRRPSQPSRQNTSKALGEQPRLRGTSGLNQRSHADVVGREASFVDGMKRSKSSASKTSTGTRVPRFHLRTVPPAVDVNRIIRPPLHVPGSYRSEFPDKQQTSHIISPSPEDRLDTTGEEAIAVPKYAGLGEGRPHQAIDALTKVADHEHIVADRSRATLPKTPPQEKFRSNSPVKHSQTLLLEARAGEVIVDQAAQPIHMSSVSRGHSHDDPFRAPVFVVGDHSGERDNRAPLAMNQRDTVECCPQVERSDLLNGPSISALLARLPPMRRSTEQVSADFLPAEPFAATEKASTKFHSPSISSLESIPLNTDERVYSQDSPLLPKPSPVNPLVKGEKEEMDRSDIEAASAAEPRQSSQKSPKVSTASRAMSMLSEISTRTGLQAPSLSSITRHRKRNSIATSNLTTKPHRRLRRAHQDSDMPPAGKGYKALNDDIQVARLESAGSTDRFLALQNQQRNGAGFTKIIQDLESLLDQALTIAGEAADKDGGENTLLKSHRTSHGYSHAHTAESVDSSQASSSVSMAGDEEDNYSSMPPQKVTIEEPPNDTPYHGHFTKALDTTRDLEIDDGTDTKQQNGNRLLNIPNTRKAVKKAEKLSRESSFTASDWAVIRAPSHTSKLRLEVKPPTPAPQTLPNVQSATKEQNALLLRAHGASESTLSREVVRNFVNTHNQPPVQPRLSSRRSKKGRAPHPEELNLPDLNASDVESDCEHVPYVADFKTAGLHYHPVYQEAIAGDGHHTERRGGRGFQPRQDTAASLRDADDKIGPLHRRERSANKDFTLNDRHHFSIRESHGFSLSRSHRRSPIARDWSTSRKRFVATVTCVTTAFMGLIVGIYAGEVPAIQYTIADEHHYTILGNVLFFLGLAITTALFYPLPLLHGRKPYTLAALAILLPLQFPQALAINSQRSPNVATYRIGLLLPRIFAGFVMGFANINFITTLMDLFGASLQSGNPHQEVVNVNDVRRHGGGMGVWLGIWTWCTIGSIGTGFLIGAGIISGLDVSWGFWITIIINAAVLVLNILTPEVRRSAYRRSMAEVRNGGEVSRRVARGEIKMHLESTGPIWWWEEVIAGHVLAIRMLFQPGFAILSLYLGWIYGQVVLVIVVSLSRQHGGLYHLHTAASWGSSFQVLSLSPPIRWPGCSNYPSWSSLCHTFSKGVFVQSSKTPCPTDRQHDI